MTAGQGIEPRPHWWKASALTTAQNLLSISVMNEGQRVLFFNRELSRLLLVSKIFDVSIINKIINVCSKIRNSLLVFNSTSPRAHYYYPLYINYRDLELGPKRLITQSINQSIKSIGRSINQQVIPRKIPNLLLPRQIPQGIF